MTQKYAFVVIVFIFSVKSSVAQGLYAGAFKKIIGLSYSNPKKAPGLSGFVYRGGTTLTSPDDAEVLGVSIFQKTTTYVILFEIQVNAETNESKILDALEVKGVKSNQEFRSGICRNAKVENIEIVALVNQQYKEYVKAIKAWRLNKEKKKIEQVAASAVDCLTEGFGE